MSEFIRLPRLVAVTAAVLFILVLGIGKAVAQVVPVDIKPGSCPNPINVNSHGVLPVAILGTDTFDVNDVDIATLSLAGLSPLRSAFEDVATPFEPFTGKVDAFIDCNELGADGILDLTLKFITDEVVGALSSLDNGALVLTLTGLLMNGTSIIGEDVILVLDKGNGGRSALAPGRNK